MTPPAGSEEVRVREWVKSQIMGEQCWEDVISVANATIEDDEWLMVDEAIEEHNALRSAYVALQARVEMHELNVSALGKRIGALCDELEAAQARLAKLEQERGRGEE